MGVMIGKDASGNIKVTFDYNPAYVERVRTIPGRKWHPEAKYWTFPFSKQILDQIVSTFAGEKVEIDSSLKLVASHAPAKKPAHTAIFDRFRDLIRLKHYSIKTEETYLHWIMRYLTFYHDRNPEEMGAAEIEAFLSYLAVNMKPGVQRLVVPLQRGFQKDS